METIRFVFLVNCTEVTEGNACKTGGGFYGNCQRYSNVPYECPIHCDICPCKYHYENRPSPYTDIYVNFIWPSSHLDIRDHG